MARVSYRGIARVVMSQGENQLFLLDQFHQRPRLFQVKGHRLIAHNMDTMLQECARNRVVQVIGHRHHDKIDAIRQTGFGLGHLLEALVRAFQIPCARRCFCSLRIGGHCSCYNFGLPIQFDGNVVNCANK